MMTKDLERKLSEAIENAKQNRHEFVTLEHILLALTESPGSVEILVGAGCNVQKLKRELRESIQLHCPVMTHEQIDGFGGYETWQPELTLACHRLFQRSLVQVRSAGKDQVTEGHILVALFYEQDAHASFLLLNQGVTQFDVINYVSHGVEKESSVSAPPVISQPESEAPDPAAPSSERASPLESFCTNLNLKAKEGRIDPLIGREDVLDRLAQILCRRTKNNPLLIGEPGVGKTAIVEGLANKIVKGTVPDALKEKVIYSLDLGGLLAGTKFRGDFEARIKAVLKEIQKIPEAILFIDEIHTLVGAGATSGGSMDASNLLKPALANGQISCIGSTTHHEFRQHFEKDRALNRRFQKIDVKEPSVPETYEILLGLRSEFEKHHNVIYSDEALKASAELSSKYIQNKLLPDKAIDVMDEAGASEKLLGHVGSRIEVRNIEETISKMTQVPLGAVSINDKEMIKDLDRKLKSVIFGQDEAIDKLVTSIKLSRTGLARETKPIGSYLFAGPTGVGKTEVCKKLAEFLGVSFIRFDMSEYQEKHTIARLIGAPPGYVGYEEGGQLTEAITKAPYCLLLLDEFEKAHPDIYSILLQVMDAGRLTDANGRIADMRNVILVMTSNAGAIEVAKGAIGIGSQPSRFQSMDAIKKIFSPEFLNRLDSIVHFQDLDESTILRVVRKFVEELQFQLTKKDVEFSVSSQVLEWIRKKGYDRIYGARPLARSIDEHLKKPLVDELLFGQLTQGGKVKVELEADSLKFKITGRKD